MLRASNLCSVSSYNTFTVLTLPDLLLITLLFQSFAVELFYRAPLPLYYEYYGG